MDAASVATMAAQPRGRRKFLATQTGRDAPTNERGERLVHIPVPVTVTGAHNTSRRSMLAPSFEAKLEEGH